MQGRIKISWNYFEARILISTAGKLVISLSQKQSKEYWTWKKVSVIPGSVFYCKGASNKYVQPDGGGSAKTVLSK